MNNYRPISILPTLNKVFEKTLKSRLMNFLDMNDFFNCRQYGFRAHSGTTVSASDVLEKIYDGIDDKNVVTGLFIDFSKAFDTVRHDILLKKLENCGIRGRVLELFQDYFHDRRQYVCFNETRSLYQTVKCGVPQGSCLGPILFLIYVNDIKRVSIHGSLFLFADESGIFYE